MRQQVSPSTAAWPPAKPRSLALLATELLILMFRFELLRNSWSASWPAALAILSSKSSVNPCLWLSYLLTRVTPAIVGAFLELAPNSAIPSGPLTTSFWLDWGFMVAWLRRLTVGTYFAASCPAGISPLIFWGMLSGSISMSLVTSLLSYWPLGMSKGDC